MNKIVSIKPFKCCEKDEFDNWLREPCCNISGMCYSDATNINDTIGNCICCGGEMFKENGTWYHHSQKDLKEEDRGTIHLGI